MNAEVNCVGQSAANERRNQQLVEKMDVLKQKVVSLEKEKIEEQNRLETAILDLQVKVQNGIVPYYMSTD